TPADEGMSETRLLASSNGAMPGLPRSLTGSRHTVRGVPLASRRLPPQRIQLRPDGDLSNPQSRTRDRSKAEARQAASQLLHEVDHHPAISRIAGNSVPLSGHCNVIDQPTGLGHRL